MSKLEFVYVICIEAPIEKVWEALTKGEHTRHFWAGRSVQSDWQEGSRVEFRMDTDDSLQHSGTVLEADPPRRLVMTFYVDSAKDPERASRVSYELSTFHGATRLKLIHDDFIEGSKTYEGVREGWPAILSSLKTYLERGTPMAMTKEWRKARAE